MNQKWTPESRWTWSGLAILFLFLLNFALPSNAQIATTTATLSGAVTDPSGAILPGATVTLMSAGNGITRQFKTDAAGRYLFSQLPPSQYSLTVKMTSFKTYEQNGITLIPAETATQDVKLTVGESTQTITVTADATLLNTDNSNVSADLDSYKIGELPSSNRNVIGMLTLNSSVSNASESQGVLGGGTNATDDADQDISFLNFNGGFFGTTAYMIDGSLDTEPEWGAVIFVPSVDAVQEMKVQSNSFTAQYGWSTGNVVNVVTKSGSNAFHGDVWDFYQNQNLNAVPFFSKPPNQSLSKEEVGGTAGGPLYIPKLYQQKEKTFLFGVFDYLTISTPQVSTYTVPDSLYQQGNFSETLGTTSLGTDALGRPIYQNQIYDPRSGHAITAGVQDKQTASNPYGTGLTPTASGFIRNPVPGNILSNIAGYTPDPVGAKLLSYYPKPTTNTATANNLVVSASSPAAWKEFGLRVDQNVNANARAYFRYSYKQEYKTGSAATWGASDPGGPGNIRPNNRWGMWAGYSQVFSPTFTMNLTAGVQIWHEDSNNQSLGFNPSTELGLPAYVNAVDPLFPQVNVGGMYQLGVNANDAQADTNHGPIGTVSADFIKLKGKHTLNFGWTGVEQVFSQKPYDTTTLDFNGNFTTGPNPTVGSGFASGNGVAQMLLGVLDTGTSGESTTTTGYSDSPYMSNHLLGEYIQDDWKPTGKLTLNLGFRYEIQTPWTYRHNAASIFNPEAQNPLGYAVGMPLLGALQFLGPGNRYVYNPNWDNLAPRLGFSYQFIPKAVLHGGYGIFYPQSVMTITSPGDQDGFSASTNINDSLNGGITPNPNISTSNPWGGSYAQVTGNANGEYQQIGNGLGGVFRSRPSPYVQQWMLGVQYAITPNDQIDVDYIGNRGVRMAGIYQSNQLNPTYLTAFGANSAAYLQAPASFNPFAIPLQQLEASSGGKIAASSCNLDGSATNAQLLSPYPQYCNASVSQTNAPVGQSLYNAMQVTFNHRLSKGLTALVSYTYSKFLDNVEGNSSWAYNGPASAGFANNYDPAADKSVDAGDIPQSLVVTYAYNLPVGRGRSFGSGMNRAVDAVIGGWELSGTATFRAGLPLGFSGSDQTTYGGNPRPDLIANPKLSHPTYHEWFNTAAFAYAPYGSFGDAPRYDANVRGPHFQEWDTIMEKNFNFTEKTRFQFRLETYNTFNHPNFYSPSATGYGGCDPNAGTGCSSGLGTITNTFTPRNVQWAGKFYW